MTQLQFTEWAKFDAEKDALVSFSGELPIQMAHSDGTAKPLILDESTASMFGADIIRFAAGKGVGLHKHIGAHILMVTKGTGVLTYEETKHDMYEGMIYLVPSNIPHAINAITELVLIAIGNDHRAADSNERLEIV